MSNFAYPCLLGAKLFVLDFEFAGSGIGDRVDVGGDLSLNGAVLNITDLGGFGPGVYTLFNYGGTLLNNNMVFGTLLAVLTA